MTKPTLKKPPKQRTSAKKERPTNAAVKRAIQKRQTNTERERIAGLIAERVAVHRTLERGVVDTLAIARECAETRRVLQNNKLHIGRFLRDLGRNRMWWSRQTRIGEYGPFQALTDQQIGRLPTGAKCLLELTRVREEEWDKASDKLSPTMTVPILRKAITDFAEPLKQKEKRTASKQANDYVGKLAQLIEQNARIVEELDALNQSRALNSILPVLEELREKVSNL